MTRDLKEGTEAMIDRCNRGCPPDECYCSEPTFAEMLGTANEQGMCTGCGGIGECYCGEE